MNDHGESDKPIVPKKPLNKGPERSDPAEKVEERGLAKGNSGQQTRSRTQRREDLQQALDRIRQVAISGKEERFTTLWHHVYNPDRLEEAFLNLKRDVSAGIDGTTWKAYAEDLEENLKDLSARLKRGAYRARPVERAYIPKPGGGKRPIGIPVLEDKIVQRATVEVLNAVYEVDFLGFSYGFRPGRSAHHALDALSVGLTTKKVNWVLDVDIRSFFDTIDHVCLMRFVEHRIADKRVLRHIKKWLKAGVLEEGKRRKTEEGTPQGGSISPLLANIYLHYVYDLWAANWRKESIRGDMITVRYADDIVAGFQHSADAERFLVELKERFKRFGLTVHPEKTRLIEFGRFAAERRKKQGKGKPATFDFLGFKHICGKTGKGRFMVIRRTQRDRLRNKLAALKKQLRKRLHWPIPLTGQWLAAVLRGHYNYYGVPFNIHALNTMRYRLIGLWHHALGRRSQKGTIPWERMLRLAERWLPAPRIVHPYPWERLNVTTRGKSRMR
jgi:group II intron reverse transcriptase/maturase